MRLTAYDNSKRYKEKVKLYHDKKLMKREFHPGQQVLLSIQDSSSFLASLNQSGQGHSPSKMLNHMAQLN